MNHRSYKIGTDCCAAEWRNRFAQFHRFNLNGKDADDCGSFDGAQAVCLAVEAILVAFFVSLLTVFEKNGIFGQTDMLWVFFVIKNLFVSLLQKVDRRWTINDGPISSFVNKW
ncbi:MAG: hypothetical protein D6694_11155 [Gammaproteobacteria bacterium]|nr:MAG: hypothetical protein D6694_11155 [Gammaproteobacteria bacterium]